MTKQELKEKLYDVLNDVNGISLDPIGLRGRITEKIKAMIEELQ